MVKLEATVAVGQRSLSYAWVATGHPHRATRRLWPRLYLTGLLHHHQLSSFLGPVRSGPRATRVAVARDHQDGQDDGDDGRNDRRPVWKRTAGVRRHCLPTTK